MAVCDLSRIFIVPLEIVPHSAPLPTTLTVPLPFARNVVQLDPQDLASRAGPPATGRVSREEADGGEGNPSHMPLSAGRLHPEPL